jgi:hypothetical protein
MVSRAFPEDLEVVVIHLTTGLEKVSRPAV